MQRAIADLSRITNVWSKNEFKGFKQKNNEKISERKINNY